MSDQLNERYTVSREKMIADSTRNSYIHSTAWLDS